MRLKLLSKQWACKAIFLSFASTVHAQDIQQPNFETRKLSPEEYVEWQMNNGTIDGKLVANIRTYGDALAPNKPQAHPLQTSPNMQKLLDTGVIREVTIDLNAEQSLNLAAMSYFKSLNEDIVWLGMDNSVKLYVHNHPSVSETDATNFLKAVVMINQEASFELNKKIVEGCTKFNSELEAIESEQAVINLTYAEAEQNGFESKYFGNVFRNLNSYFDQSVAEIVAGEIEDQHKASSSSTFTANTLALMDGLNINALEYYESKCEFIVNSN
jgi:hypothetical protein